MRFGGNKTYISMEFFKEFKRFPYFLQFLYEKITSSIAFIPLLMATGFFLFTGLMFYAESQGLTPWMEERLPSVLFIKDWGVALSVLNVLVGALISLMVFSFSMVMVLLNNAASNFSPRILPSLISNTFHQIVLGTYLGTITYCLLMIVNMTPNQDKIPLPGFSVFLGINFGVVCLFLFVFFINSISESVQVEKILRSLYSSTLDNMKNGVVSRLSDEEEPQDVKKWHPIAADRSGYFQSVNLEKIGKIGAEENLKIKIVVSESKFILEGIPLFLCDKELEEEIQHKILENFVLTISENVKDDHLIGFKQITEIALKAMSPGINDPGTALSAINYLTILFMEKMKLPEAGAVVFKDDNDQKLPTNIWMEIVGFDELLFSILAPLRQYARHDLMVMMKMLEMLKFLHKKDYCTNKQREIIHREIKVLVDDAEEYLTNSADYNRVLTFSESIMAG